MKTLHTLIGAAFIAGASAVAVAEPVEPIALNEAELDGVTAGLTFLFLDASAYASAEGVGTIVFNHTETEAGAGGVVVENAFGPFDYAYGGSGSSSSSSSF